MSEDPTLDDASLEVHGYFKTAEGRDFLREIYPIFRERVPFKDRKIANIIADDAPLDQDKENDRTRSALKRWAKGQNEFWGKDASKSLRLMLRLEVHMMAYPVIAELLDDRAMSIHKASFGNAMKLFFNGSLRNRTGRMPAPEVTPNGLYLERYSALGLEDNGDVRSGFGHHFYYQPASSGDYLLVKEFALYRPNADRPTPVFADRFSGFAFLTERGDVFRYMISLQDPRERRIDSLRRVLDTENTPWFLSYQKAWASYRYNVDSISKTPLAKEVDRVAVLVDGKLTDDYVAASTFDYKIENEEYERSHAFKRYCSLKKVNDSSLRFIERHLSGNEWDLLI